MSDVVLLEKQGPIAIITINRADTMNPLGQAGDGEAFEKLRQDIENDETIRAAILTGSGRAFSAGGDVKAMKNRIGAFGGSPYNVRQGYRKNIHKIVKSLYNLEVPLIDKAKFGVTFLKLGLIPGDGGAWLMPRIVGNSRAAELLFTGKVINAQTASDWGLVSEVVPADTLMEASLEMARQIAAQPPQSLRLAKTLLRHGTTASYETIMEMSAAGQALMHHTEDHIEGVDAILEKRTPEFKGE